jgi:hypothetical protein
LSGSAFAAKDAIFEPGDGSGNGASIHVADFTGLCALGTAAAKANAKYVDFTFTASALQVGVTNVGASLDVSAEVDDQACNSTSEVAASGTVTLTQVNSCGVVGTFDITFTPDHLTGSFTAPTCTAPRGDGGCK